MRRRDPRATREAVARALGASREHDKAWRCARCGNGCDDMRRLYDRKNGGYLKLCLNCQEVVR